MTCMLSSRTKEGTEPSFYIFWVLQWFYNGKVYFSRLMRVFVGLIMLADCSSSRFPCFLLVSRVWDISSGIDLASHWQKDCTNCTPMREKMKNTEPTTLSATGSKPIHFYQCTILLHFSGNDKNKQLTFLIQPMQTSIYWKKYVNGSVNSEEQLKNKTKTCATLIQVYTYPFMSSKSPIYLVRQHC